MNRFGRSAAASKAEFLRLREQLALSRQARELLEQKRDRLMEKALEELRASARLRRDLTERWRAVLELWWDCLEEEGAERLARLSKEVPELPDLDGAECRYLGVMLSACSLARPELPPLGAVFDCGLKPERVRGLLADLLPDLVRLMNHETNVRRLAGALRRVQRQVNALEQVLIPEMEGEAKYIEQAIEEKEREALFQTKRLKEHGS
jgi:V/A-type H+-transporting ATPase subunit D